MPGGGLVTPTRTSPHPWIAALLSAAALAAACSGRGNPFLGPTPRAWADGPVRWLMLPAETRQFRRLRSDGEAAIFVEEFWRRRDADPTEPGNAARERFEARVAAADRQYGELEVRGSLTDRGRALVLLGPPSLLRHGRRASPTWAPARPLRTARGGGASLPVRYLIVETWEYRLADLSPPLAALVTSAGGEGITLTFVLGEQARLIEGGRFLDMAAEAAVRLAG